MRGSLGRLVTVVAVASLLPTVVAAIFVLRSDLSPTLRVAIAVAMAGLSIGAILSVRSRSRYRLRTLSNLLAALREGDYSFRARRRSRTDPFDEVIAELNLLAENLRRQRVEDLEATALVREVMAEIDVAVFAFDTSHRLRQVNRAGEALLGGGPVELGTPASQLGLDACLTGPPARNVRLTINGSTSRWEMRRGAFRQQGRPNLLLVLSDVSRALHAEELAAWKRMIRVIGHELNNSLAPITSLTDSMARLVRRDPLPDDWRGDVLRGFDVIASRVEALNRFMTDCSRLARIPEPTLSPLDVGACVRRIVELEGPAGTRVLGGPELTVPADRDQIEQVLINLLRNAVEAGAGSDRPIEIFWAEEGRWVEISIRDRGTGLEEPENLFVPFSTTKPDGSGIGLFLCRHIAEAHDGSITVRDRSDGPGCEAILRLPGHTVS